MAKSTTTDGENVKANSENGSTAAASPNDEHVKIEPSTKDKGEDKPKAADARDDGSEAEARADQHPEKPAQANGPETADGDHHPFANSYQVDSARAADDPNVVYLRDDEIETFLDELDHNGDGCIDYSEVERKLDEVHDELAPTAQPHHLHHDSKQDRERHVFLRSVIGSDQDRIPRADFARVVKSWRVPSMKQEGDKKDDQDKYLRDMSTFRRVRAYWAVHGPEIAFLGIVVGLQLGLGIWQCHKYASGEQYQAAFGWGVALAKLCAGALYPTFFFLILSMSRYFSTFLRRSYHLSRFINWDLSQEFHIKISIVALVLASLHALGHLSGTFNWGSRPERQDAVGVLLGEDQVPRPYSAYVSSLPGITGLTALGLFYTLALLSMPQVRRWNYEVFQLAHLLMFPIIGLLAAHGTAQLLQYAMFGYWLAVPTILVLTERLVRVGTGFHRIPASLKVLDDETVELRATIPSERIWKYQAGQWAYLQVPTISMWQWHPFTISVCVGKEMRMHIKTDGNWTGRLRDLAKDAPQGQEVDIEIGINGPFGAPAQRFYDFNHTILVGAGIGLTPFSGILADLQAKEDRLHGGPTQKLQEQAEKGGDVRGSTSADSPSGGRIGTSREAEAMPQRTDVDMQAPTSGDQSNTTLQETADADSDSASSISRPSSSFSSFASDYRRVDFHWMVRDRNHLLWISELLNTVSRSQAWHHRHDAPGEYHLDIRMQTHVTQKRKNVSTHVYRWLLEQHRTPEHPASPITGLINPTQFGRPDFVSILDRHYDDMRKYKAGLVARASRGGGGEDDAASVADDEVKVGVFFCGTPIVGEILADRCKALTARGRHDGSKIEYHFMIEVFN